MSRRVHFIDWLRVLAVLLLFPFHTARVYNVGERFYVKGSQTSVALSYFIAFVDRWHMPLLFLLAGASSYFALRRRSGVEYTAERGRRLLVPLVFGVLVLIPPQTWIGGRFNSGNGGSFWTYMSSGSFLTWNIREGGDYFGGLGLGHLWFILYLLLLSLVALPLMLRLRGDRGSEWASRWSKRLARPVWWWVPALVIFIAEGLPDVAGKNPFYYLSFFLLGYIVLHDEAFTEAAERSRWATLAAGAVLSATYAATWQYRESLPDPSVPLALMNLGGTLGTWLALLGLLGLGKRYLDSRSPTLGYLAEGSYAVYILHQTVIVVLAAWVIRLSADVWVEWPVLLAASVAVTFAIYELIRRANVTRFLFGMKPKS